MNQYEVPSLIEEAYANVVEMFDGDLARAELWFVKSNPHFGGASPVSLFLRGRGHKVAKFIETAIDENREG